MRSLVLAAVALFALSAAAQDYPVKPVRVVVFYAAGGPRSLRTVARACDHQRERGVPSWVARREP